VIGKRATSEQVIRRPLRLYVIIVAFYGLLLGWWVYFFASLDDRLLDNMQADGVTLSGEAEQAVRETSGEAMRMFLFEGGFLGLLVLVSVFLVMRGVQREIMLARQQRNFVSAVTHELRSPLSSARLYIDSILMGRVSAEKTERYLKHAREDLDRLGSMVEDILDTRRISESGVELETEVVDLAELASDDLPRLRELHVPHEVQLDLHAPEPVFARADVTAFRQILDNLVSNAVKYGGDGSRVDIEVLADGRMACLSVRDHGPGLQGVDPSHLSEPFVRGGDEMVRTRAGVGLGLYIVREFARAHGGELKLEDGLEGGGTRVSVTLPLVSQAAPLPSQSAGGVA
jgi:signal transduction histidine kinase